ncbi:MAG: NEL-type E3 ubiquitin ligase domain-containing protein [Candidatus Endonucleobacter bathymodioli]|uniref:NEL-type E3 ubiquitin ligase domain-containing protein n=1 Tax=Candidatus Endonucleibacter bathymodioli TaxID=539814 RepID=A0AA90NWE4_9GAMM|nr:NEL-type E3 ubiquitin ligase domain-containing protein [Candidatus Endonucleobacter bathymodioli]
MCTNLYFRRSLIFSLITITIIFNTGATLAVGDKNSATSPNNHHEIHGSIERTTPMDINSVIRLIQPELNIMSKDLQENTSTVRNSIIKTDTQPSQEIMSETISKRDKKTVDSMMQNMLIVSKDIEERALRKLILEGSFCNYIHYKITGDFVFVNEPLLTIMPNNLTVTGALKISRCVNLKTLSKNLNADTIEIEYCDNLTTIPDNLHIKYLHINGCHGLLLLPDTLIVDVTAKIVECSKLKHLPSNFVKINLIVENCGELKTLGHDLTLTGKLEVSQCHKLTTIVANDLTVGSFFINENKILETLANKVRTTETSGALLRASSIVICPNLRTLAETMIITRYLTITECPELTHLPTKLEVGGMFIISYCDKITTLGYRLNFTSRVSMTNLKNLKTIGNNIIIGGLLTLRDNPNLKTIGNDITAHGIICIGCPDLEEIGDRVTVENDFGLIGCTNLVTINNTLKVGGHFDLDYCVTLAHLPGEKFELGGDLSLAGCNNLTAIPGWITTLGAKKDGDTRRVYLPYNNSMIRTVTEELLKNEVQGMEFIRYQPTDGEEALYPISLHTFGTFTEAFTFWKNLASPSQTSVTNIPIPDLQPNESADLIKFLELLTTTTDYKDENTRNFMAERVISILPFIIKKSEYQEHFLNILFSYLSSCIDGINFSLNELETALLIKDAEAQAMKNNNPSTLKEVGMKMMILAKIKEISAEYITKKLSGNDPVSVRMGFQIGLQEKFNLPGLAKSMHFITFSGVNQEDIDKAIIRISDSCTDAELNIFLTTWEPWEKYQRFCYIPKFDTLSSVPVININECAILHDTCNEMVLLNNVHVSYDALCKFFIDSGNNPFTNDVLHWSDVHKLILSHK